MVGLMPLLWSTGPGADMMKRVAAPMVGGLGKVLFCLSCVCIPPYLRFGIVKIYFQRRNDNDV